MFPATTNALLRLFGRSGYEARSAANVRATMRVEEVERRILHSADLAALVVSEIDGAQVQMRVLEAASDALVPAVTVEQSRRYELVIVDTAIVGYEQIVADIAAQADDARRFDFVLIGSGEDGVAAIGAALSASAGVDAIHVISHGAP